MRMIVILACLAEVFCIAVMRQANAQVINETNEVVCDLQYKSGGFNLSWWVKEDKSIKETKGPDFGEGVVRRGVIQSSAAGAEPMLFVLDKSESKLYFDLNNNLDLTDDADGVFHSNEDIRDIFTAIKIERKFDNVRVPYIISVDLWSDYRFTVLSGFEGDVKLADKSWRILFADNLDGIVGEGDYFAIASADSNFVLPTYTTVMDVPKEVFLDGRNWVVSYEFAEIDGKPCVRTRFKQTPRETGSVSIEGRFIRYMTLRDGRTLTVLEHPEGKVELPTGEHRFGEVFLDEGEMGQFERYRYGYDRFSVEKDQVETLKVGGPLTSTVEIKRIGRFLQLNYKLKGIDGKEYTSRDRGADRANAPEFVIYKGDKKIASGVFEFG